MNGEPLIKIEEFLADGTYHAIGKNDKGEIITEESGVYEKDEHGFVTSIQTQNEE